MTMWRGVSLLRTVEYAISDEYFVIKISKWKC